MPQKTRILLLSTTYLPSIGGSELAIKNITDRLMEFDFDLITSRLDKRVPKTEKIGNVNIYRVGGNLSLVNFLLPKIFLPLAVFFKAKTLLKNEHYTAIHAYQASGAAGAGWLLKIFYPKIPFIITLQEGKNLEAQGRLINFFRKLILQKADMATAISSYLKNYIFKNTPELKTELIPNGVDIESFSRNFSYGEMTELDKKLGLMPDDKVIISVSRLVEKNGVDLLIETMAMLKLGSSMNYKLVLAGEGSLKESLKLKVKSLMLEDRVVFAGEVSPDELPLYLKIGDVFVRPSRSEGLGSAFLEAMAAGLPVIGTRVGGIPDFLTDRKTGLLTTGEPKDISFKIRIVLENDKLRQEMIENSLYLIKEKYDWAQIADSFQRIYNGFAKK